jgi:uncharacterized repeat protein (TIGR01451 family)
MRSIRRSAYKIRLATLAALTIFGWTGVVAADPSAPHASPPDPASLWTLVRTGRVQIVRFETPAGADLEIASSSGVVRLALPAQVALAAGQPYRVRISNIPGQPALTFYPTLRLIGFIMPPAGVDPLDHPIPVHFVAQDFQDAAQGRLVSNVIYLEDPATAYPVAFPPGELPVVDLSPGEDVMREASALGRPILFIQMGNWQPTEGEFDSVPAAPPVHILPDSASHHSLLTPGAPGLRSTDHSPITPASHHSTLTTHHSPILSPSVGLRPSLAACQHNPPVVRQSYKVHPRMPWDEYLCDGGDRVPYAHFSGHTKFVQPAGTDDEAAPIIQRELVGLTQGEAVAQFSRPGEKPRLVASNEVCVYAPRFALMRSSSVSVEGLQIETPRGVGQLDRRGMFRTRTTADERTGRQPARTARGRTRHSGMLMVDIPAGMDETRLIAALHQHEYFAQLAGHVGPNEAGQADEARLAKSIEAAAVWNRVQFPAYTAIIEGGGQITGYMQTGEVQQAREPYRKPGELVLTKAARPLAAQPGDIIELAIYYRNIGQRPLESISIIDSLTARLEYVPGSAKSDRTAIFTAAPNEVESSELRWDVRDPLPGGEAGMVWFQAKVR